MSNIGRRGRTGGEQTVLYAPKIKRIKTILRDVRKKFLLQIVHRSMNDIGIHFSFSVHLRFELTFED